jgi:hypothetical protein
MKKFHEPIKSAILVILICLMVYQTGRLWLFTSEAAALTSPFPSKTASFLRAIGVLSDTPAALAATDQGKAISFMPLSISFKMGKDVKAAAASQKTVETAMDIAGDLLKKALSNSSEFEQREKKGDLLSEALSGDGVLFDMGVPVSTGILTLLLNVQSRFEGVNDLFIEYVFITPSKQGASVYLYDSLHDEVCLLNNSEIEEKTLDTLLSEAIKSSEFLPAKLAGDMHDTFNDSGMLELSPFITVVTNPVTSNVLMSQNPIYSKEQREFNAKSLHSVLSAFFYNPYSTRSYPESDGSLVYVENDSTLRFTQDGLAIYRANSPQKGIALEKLSPAQVPSVSAIVEASYALLSRFDKSVCGGNAGSARFKKIEYVRQEDCYRVYMDYICNGIPVKLTPNNNAPSCMAVLDFSPDGALTHAQVFLRHYSFGDYAVNNVNQSTAIKVLGAQDDRKKRLYGMNLEYVDDLKGTVYSEWVARMRAEG